MRFTIFKRIASGYALIMVMVIFMGIYVTLKLNQLTEINYKIARVDGAIISMGEQLLDSLFSQAGFEMKYLISRDPDFYQEFNSRKVFSQIRWTRSHPSQIWPSKNSGSPTSTPSTVRMSPCSKRSPIF